MTVTSPKELREVIDGIVCRNPAPAPVRSYFQFALRLAETHLRHSKSRFAFKSEVGLRSVSDLALDSISDLFERDDQYVFVRLVKYYEGINYWDITDLELWSATRRLVSTTISDSIFRHYREADPSLSKIIRNIKRGVSLRQDLSLSVRFGSSIIVHSEHAGRVAESHTVEGITAILLPSFRLKQNISHALMRLEQILKSETRYSGFVRLSEFALAIRQCCVHLNDNESDERDHPLFEPEELDQLLEEALTESLRTRQSFYLSKGKLSLNAFESMIKGVRVRLHASISSDAESGLTNFEAFQMAFPDVSQEEYREQYRHVFEYFHRMAYDELVTRARKWSTPQAS